MNAHEERACRPWHAKITDDGKRKQRAGISQLFLLAAIRTYQRIAPSFIRGMCRFEPCCSDYALKAIEKYGPLKGVGKSAIRIMKCFPPFGGVDYP